MGVKDLWSILSPVCERKTLWELQDKTIAIDLSCWVCDSQNIRDSNNQPRMYLRNLFFRANCLLLLGAHPIFILEGQAPELKYSTMDKRKNMRKKEKFLGQTEASQKGKRCRLNALLNKCQQLLTIMGLPCVKSPGEAEAFCAVLDRFEYVDGCITQDGDSFLYGAQTVYRNFTISSSGGSSGSNAGFSIDVYKMSVIEDKLSLGRNELIAISLLCGCDYNEKGVSGIGKETVLKFLSGVKDEDILNRLKRWRTDPRFNDLEEKRSLVTRGILCEVCGHGGKKIKHLKSGCELCGELKGCKHNSSFALSDPAIVAELNIRRRALLDPKFPSQMMINEFLQQDLPTDDFTLDKNWKKPDLQSFILFADKLLGWTNIYALEKFLPLVTRWQILELQKEYHANLKLKFPFTPLHIVKKRVLRGVESYEINWLDVEGIVTQIDPNLAILTVEPRNLVEKAYPQLVEAYITTENLKSKKVATRKKENCPKNDAKKITLKGEKNDMKLTGKQIKIDKFFKMPLTNTVQRKRCALGEQTNIINKANEICVESKEKLNLKLPETNTVKRLTEYLSEMKLDSEESIVEKPIVRDSELTESKDLILSHSCNHQQENVNFEDNLEKSLFWDVCELCAQDDSIDDEDLSFIVDSIVNTKTSCKIEDTMHKPSVNNDTDTMACNGNGSFDEFDLITDEYVPLIDRIRSQL